MLPSDQCQPLPAPPSAQKSMAFHPLRSFPPIHSTVEHSAAMSDKASKLAVGNNKNISYKAVPLLSLPHLIEIIASLNNVRVSPALSFSMEDLCVLQCLTRPTSSQNHVE